MHCLPGTSYVLTRAPHLARRNYFRSHERMDKKIKLPPVARREELFVPNFAKCFIQSWALASTFVSCWTRISGSEMCTNNRGIMIPSNYKGMGNTKVMGNWFKFSNVHQLVEIKADQSADGSVSPNKMHFQLIFNAPWRPVNFSQIRWKMLSSAAFLCAQESCHAGNRIGLHQTNFHCVVV